MIIIYVHIGISAHIDIKNDEKMTAEVFQIDDVDKNIIELIQREPTLTHTEIAKKVHRSQPTVGMRIRKLESQGVLKFQAGLNLKTTNLVLVRVELQTLDPDEIIALVGKCPYILNAFKLSGQANLSLFLIAPKLEHLDNIVNNHFRKNPNVTNVYMDVITEVIRDFVLPFDFNFESCSLKNDGSCCGKCLNQIQVK
jgi:Lrp/AsnC family leucine-responsive transcriptional regulator